MPYKQETVNSPQMPFIYNVEQAVGQNSPNGKGDVILVQYLLAAYYGPNSLQIDGWIGPVTTGYIKKFQQEAKQSGNNVLVDSRVDKAYSYTSSISQTVYTIILLNVGCKSRNPQAYDALPSRVPLSPKPRANPYNPATAPPSDSPVPGGFNPGVGDPKYGGKYVVDQKTYKILGTTWVFTYWSDGTMTSRSGPSVSYMY